jgi:hypothetical protein
VAAADGFHRRAGDEAQRGRGVSRDQAGEVEGLAERAVQHVFGDERIAALILSQQLIGKKVWVK